MTEPGLDVQWVHLDHGPVDFIGKLPPYFLEVMAIISDLADCAADAEMRSVDPETPLLE